MRCSVSVEMMWAPTSSSGPFIDLEDPNNLVWLRGFTSIDARRRALECFYDGPVWNAQKDAANATMINSDNVLLLQPTSPEHPLDSPEGSQADFGSRPAVPNCIHITSTSTRPTRT